jgi:hypothetical protein
MTCIRSLANAYRLRTGDYGHCPLPSEPVDDVLIYLGLGALGFALVVLWVLL